ncbi:DUF523 domain-containing protein [Chromobacterium haemolyticum]|nr:DUF523 domain-containing protein [Chromobacterium haemolyticum]
MEVKPTLLVSACLLGQPVRYDGQAKPLAEHDMTGRDCAGNSP